MIAWWTSLSVMMKVLWGITIASSLIFVIQTILTFLGANSDFSTDFDMDSSGADIDMSDGNSGMGLLTFRNFINFLIGFGWSAILLHSEVTSTSVLIVISTLVGVALVAIVIFLFKWVSGMQQSGNIDVFKSAVDCVGKVYLTIPARRQGEGKVQISINNSVREYNAVTDGDKLPTGWDIRVVEVISENTMLVEEVNSLII